MATAKEATRTVFVPSSDDGYRQVLSGVRLKALAHGQRMLMTEFRLVAGSDLPRHRHPQEQTGYLVSGHLRVSIGDETFDALPGDSWCVPADVEHGAEVLADTVALEVFSPVREDYLRGPGT